MIRIINKSSFEVEIDTSKYTAYEQSGLAKYVKTPKIIHNKPLN